MLTKINARSNLRKWAFWDFHNAVTDSFYQKIAWKLKLFLACIKKFRVFLPFRGLF